MPVDVWHAERGWTYGGHPSHRLGGFYRTAQEAVDAALAAGYSPLQVEDVNAPEAR